MALLFAHFTNVQFVIQFQVFIYLSSYLFQMWMNVLQTMADVEIKYVGIELDPLNA